MASTVRVQNGIASLLQSVIVFTLLVALTPTYASDANTPIVAMDADPELREKLLAEVIAKGSEYEPRTEHLFDDGSPVYTNRLILEDSPYLIQHAHNPVNWYPWGPEAFAAAKAQNKPVFLSIGYATCHWCHVMERESFENVTVAENMNANYISIKIDREQLPDIDAMYMTAVMMINGSGGWPMSSWLDAEGQPFFGGTYYPADTFNQLLNRVTELWETDKSSLLTQAMQVSEAMRKVNQTSSAARDVGEVEIKAAYESALSSYDESNGGFGEAPKFPRESTLYFLLDKFQRDQNPEALTAVDGTLKKMAAGGIHDHIGGGFHRYAVDSQWLVPHFEKMLYNQALLARNYAQAWTLTGNLEHKRTSTRILDYVLREMRNDDGLFYSATDADSEGEEGRFFVWTPEELVSVLGKADAAKAIAVWNVHGEGNFEGHSILHNQRNYSELAEFFNQEESELVDEIDQWSQKLLEARQSREKPLLDSKVLTSWNSMMITAFAEGSGYLNNTDYLEAAVSAATELWDKMHRGDGRLFRSLYEGRSSIDGTQPDYAYFAESLIALYDATGNPEWLSKAIVLTDEMHNQFWDVNGGGYFMGGAEVAGTSVAVRAKDIHDNSLPAGNSVALRVLAKLANRSSEPRFENRADELITALSANIEQSPAAFYYFLLGASEHLQGESGSYQFAARGFVKTKVDVLDDKITIDVEMAPGWHINSDKPNQDYLIPTKLSIGDGKILSEVNYPSPITTVLSFENTELSLFEGNAQITAALPNSIKQGIELQLQLQACNDKHCLPPETVPLSLPTSALLDTNQ